MALSGEGEYNWWRSRLSKSLGSSTEWPGSEPRQSEATGNSDQDIPWPFPNGVHNLATTLDELVKAQPRVLERAANPGTQAWLVKGSWGILLGQWRYSEHPLRDTVGQQREISAGNAKQGDFSLWGVTHNGSDGRVERTRRDCLCGPRGRTRVSVCK
jgi:hypothetical protein